MNSPNISKRILVTGGNGFIGSHVAKKLFDQGYMVRIVDIIPESAFRAPICSEFVLGNLCDESVAKRAVIKIDIVLHFAANMGGMGTIHESNEARIYLENHTMTFNILNASRQAGVGLFLFASSACVYPTDIQQGHDGDVSLHEDQVWQEGKYPCPQGLYGLEKLVSEMLVVQQRQPALEIRLARFHNVYGPFGAWNNGREKAPAAMLRKAYALSYLQKMVQPLPPFEIWGDGHQGRSFLYIDDAVEAILLLINKPISQPLNIGSSVSVTIQSLADIALASTSINKSKVSFSHLTNAPLGVTSRNSSNELVQRALAWTPKISLEEGMRQTGEWINDQISDLLAGRSDEDRVQLLNRLLKSQIIDLESEDTTFAIILPITSRASSTPDDCLLNLGRFANSLFETTWRDIRMQGKARFRFTVYLGIDSDDHFLLPSTDRPSRAAEVLIRNGILDVEDVICDHPRGHICSIWRSCATKAWEEKCDFFVLMGDDVIIKDEGWLRAVMSDFRRISSERQLPFGFGCVAFTDVTFPGMPTFPIIHKTHMDIFDGVVVPPVFLNQDGDPFLFQLYRRWGCSHMMEQRLSNGIGGSDTARYVKQHATGWTFEPLTNAISIAQTWLDQRKVMDSQKLTIDIVIPCYRVDLSILRRILSLVPSPTATVMFIVIIDNPNSPHIAELEKEFSHRPDVRIRVNATNMGASESRNRGMRESAADWVHFLDDDVRVDENLLVEAEKIIRQYPNAAGFVGSTTFPQSTSIFTSAVHLAGVTFFWNIASYKQFADDVPWGVTANLIARRLKDGIWYDPVYPKTGGGEDIDFCRKKRDHFLKNVDGGEGFIAAPNVKVVHPYWNNGGRSYRRFYMWGYGDGALVARFPDLVYQAWAPNSAELLGGCFIASAFCFLKLWNGSGLFFIKAFVSVFLANILFDIHQHLFRHPERAKEINTTVRGFAWILAILESSLIRMASEMGRLHGLVDRGEWRMIGRRFDWFAGRLPTAIDEEKMNSVEKCIVAVVLLAIVA